VSVGEGGVVTCSDYPIEPEFSDTIEIPGFRLPPAVAQLRIVVVSGRPCSRYSLASD
jgi:hypothetical protein